MAYILQTKDKRMHVLKRSLACTKSERDGEVCMFLGIDKKDMDIIKCYMGGDAADTVAKYNNYQVEIKEIEAEIEKQYWSFTRCAQGQPPEKALYTRKRELIELMEELPC